jgi:hypothetical protein
MDTMPGLYNFLTVTTRGEIHHRPVVGMQFLHERRALTERRRFPRDPTALMSLIIGYFTGPQQRMPRCSVAIRVFTPSGTPAVKIRCQ